VKRKARLKARVQCVYLPLIKAVQFEALLSERPSLSSRNNQRDCSIPVQFPADMGSVLNCIPMLVGYGLNSGLTCVCVCVWFMDPSSISLPLSLMVSVCLGSANQIKTGSQKTESKKTLNKVNSRVLSTILKGTIHPQILILFVLNRIKTNHYVCFKTQLLSCIATGHSI